jgi:hypothetical protein
VIPTRSSGWPPPAPSQARRRLASSMRWHPCSVTRSAPCASRRREPWPAPTCSR